MNHNQIYRFWRSAGQCLLGGIAVALVTFVCFRLNVSITTAALLYLIVVVLASLMGSFVLSAVVSLIAILCLDYFFTEPLFTIDVTLRHPLNAVALITFLTTALVITSLMSKVHKSFEVLREQARLLDLTHDTIFVRDMNDVITYWNRGAEELYGWTKEEAVGKVSHQLMQTIFPAPLEEINAELLRTGRWEGELVHTKRDGTQVVVASRWSMQQDEQGRPLATLETNNDITERKRADEVLRKQALELRDQAQLLELAHDAILVRDLSSTIIFWNRGAERMYGWTREEAKGEVTHAFLQTAFPRSFEDIEAELHGGGYWEGELVHTTQDGSHLVVASRQVLQRDQSGNAVAILEINRDITERKRAEEALRKAQTDLAHVTRVATVGELTASIAHEVNQPLSGVVLNGNACLRWLGGDTPNLDEACEAARRIIRDGKRASDIITRIRALVRKTDTEKARLDMNDAIQEVAALAQGELRKNKVALRTELAGNLPPVLGDRVQLQQVILNLVMNGVEAMASVADRPRELLICSRQHESDQVLVAVQDCGIGIDRENTENIFNAFYTTKSHGMGMGLAISRSIVENHGGRLWAGPNDGPGATFQFTLLQHH